MFAVGKEIVPAVFAPDARAGAFSGRSFQKIDDFSKDELKYLYKKTKELKA